MVASTSAVARSLYEWQPLPEDSFSTLLGDDVNLRRTLQIGALWFASSAILSTYANTAFLHEFGDPMSHAVVRFSTSAIIGLTSMAVQKPAMLVRVPGLLKELWLPAACLLAANVLNSLALQLSGITICYVVKSSIPVLTAALCLIRGESFPPLTYAALAAVCSGVALASFSDSEYCAAGLAAAFGSAVAQTALNLTSKQALLRLGLSGGDGQCVLTCCCTLASLPMYAIGVGAASGERSLSSMVAGQSGVFARGSSVRSLCLVVAVGIAYHAEYSLNFAFVRLVSPLTFSVADVARRLAVIISGALFFQKALSAFNGVGIALSLGGTLCFMFMSSRQGAGRTKRPRHPASRR